MSISLLSFFLFFLNFPSSPAEWIRLLTLGGFARVAWGIESLHGRNMGLRSLRRRRETESQKLGPLQRPEGFVFLQLILQLYSQLVEQILPAYVRGMMMHVK